MTCRQTKLNLSSPDWSELFDWILAIEIAIGPLFIRPITNHITITHGSRVIVMF